MANTAQARKRARQSEKRRSENASLRSELRTAIKKVRKAIASGDQAAAQTQLQQSQSRIDAIARKRIIHANTAARNKSRLAHAIRAMGAPAA
jgi:small subunit ribosomal protein S20